MRYCRNCSEYYDTLVVQEEASTLEVLMLFDEQDDPSRVFSFDVTTTSIEQIQTCADLIVLHNESGPFYDYSISTRDSLYAHNFVRRGNNEFFKNCNRRLPGAGKLIMTELRISITHVSLESELLG